MPDRPKKRVARKRAKRKVRRGPVPLHLRKTLHPADIGQSLDEVAREVRERLEAYLMRLTHCTCREPLPCRRYCGRDLCGRCQRVIETREEAA